METSSIARIRLAVKPRRERRTTSRDRRILEGTIKYQGCFFNVEVTDVSESGAYLVAPVVPEHADCLTLAIGLPALGKSVMVSGRVRRVGLGSRVQHRPGGFGIQFTRFFSRGGHDSLKEHLAPTIH